MFIETAPLCWSNANGMGKRSLGTEYLSFPSPFSPFIDVFRFAVLFFFFCKCLFLCFPIESGRKYVHKLYLDLFSCICSLSSTHLLWIYTSFAIQLVRYIDRTAQSKKKGKKMRKKNKKETQSTKNKCKKTNIHNEKNQIECTKNPYWKKRMAK